MNLKPKLPVRWGIGCVLAGLLGVVMAPPCAAQQKLPISEFLKRAAQNDRVFEHILMDNLRLKYTKAAQLPAADLVFEVKGSHQINLTNRQDEPVLNLSLSRLFPATATSVSLSYDESLPLSATAARSTLQFFVSQPVARNAFGHGTRLHEQLIGLENRIARFQVIEAYEDYFYSLLSVYFDWYSAYEELQVGRASHNANLKLLANIRSRQRQNIALPIDVNKMRLLVLGKKENTIVLREKFRSLTALIVKSIHSPGPDDEILPGQNKREPVPEDPSAYFSAPVDFDREYAQFKRNSRTYGILSLLRQRGATALKMAADELLPSTNIFIGYESSGQNRRLGDDGEIVWAGISLQWPLPDHAGRAREALEKIEHEKTQVNNENKFRQLHADLKALFLAIEREKELIGVSGEKIKLSAAILKDEARNYSFGQVTLNDYIDAVNRMDENRFNLITHQVRLSKLLAQWRRLTDVLVTEKVLGAQ